MGWMRQEEEEAEEEEADGTQGALLMSPFIWDSQRVRGVEVIAQRRERVTGCDLAWKRRGRGRWRTSGARGGGRELEMALVAIDLAPLSPPPPRSTRLRLRLLPSCLSALRPRLIHPLILTTRRRTNQWLWACCRCGENAGLSSDGEATEPSAFISRASKSLRRSPGKDPQGSRKKRGRKTWRRWRS